jgi:hypothetical protein
MFETIKQLVCAQTFFYINDTMYCFLITYLLLDTINFAKSGICLSEVCLKETSTRWNTDNKDSFQKKAEAAIIDIDITTPAYIESI